VNYLVFLILKGTPFTGVLMVFPQGGNSKSRNLHVEVIGFEVGCVVVIGNFAGIDICVN
jgi:hypothetical protein